MYQTFHKSIRPFHVALKVGIVLATIIALFIGSALTVFAAGPVTITVNSVVQGSYVTLIFNNLPVNDQFAVSMGAGGSIGVGAIVAHFGSADGGFQIHTFEILDDLRSAATIAVRIDDGAGVAAFTTFNNVGMAAATGTPAPTLSSTSVYQTAIAPSVTPVPAKNLVSPTVGAIHVIHVELGGWVQVIIDNLPVNTTFTATVGSAGSQGFGGSVVGTMETGSATTHVALFEIPQTLKSAASMDLRLAAPGFLYLITFSNTNL